MTRSFSLTLCAAVARALVPAARSAARPERRVVAYAPAWAQDERELEHAETYQAYDYQAESVPGAEGGDDLDWRQLAAASGAETPEPDWGGLFTPWEAEGAAAADDSLAKIYADQADPISRPPAAAESQGALFSPWTDETSLEEIYAYQADPANTRGPMFEVGWEPDEAPVAGAAPWQEVQW
mmetsp:Transcript_7863/g.24693  ORF Transcript_7863/g.24693 Transcript_7863/m.24693 type:complete len:182 (+) Transcript_7863:130-675(+)